MLICPQCESENPDNNKFCQRCGNSLIQKNCNQCGTKVNYTEENCPNCGALTATVRWAIFSQPENLTQETPVSETLEPQISFAETTVDNISGEVDDLDNNSLNNVIDNVIIDNSNNTEVQQDNETEDEALNNIVFAEIITENAPENALENALENVINTEEIPPQILSKSLLEQVLIEGEYLDTGKRYRLLSSEKESLLTQLQSGANTNNLIRVKVADTRPVQESRLDILLRELGELDTIKEHLKNTLVKPYLAFEEYGSIVPKAYDGWQDENQNIVIIDDRSQYLTLTEYLKDESVPLPHVLYLMKEMARLWQVLGKYNCLQSLFKPDNLCLDEDLTFCFKQLIPDSKGVKYTLENLVKQWQFFLDESGKECADFVKLVEKVEQGFIQTEKQLCDELEIIACQELGEENFDSNMMEEIETEEMSQSDLITIAHKHDAISMNYTSEGDDIPTIVLPMQLLSLTDSGVTDIGLQRDHNEDFFGLQTTMITRANPVGRLTQAKGLYIVCDGMGGHDAGEVASAMAVEKLQNYFKNKWQDDLPDEDTIKEAILTANQAIYDVNMENSRSGSGRMGTTLVMALVQDTKVAIAHVGDSRVYKITRKGGAEQLTIDHEVGQREIQRGLEPEIAYGRPDAYQLTQALGPRNNDFVQPDISFLDINEDSVLLLCSDGLCDNDLVENNWETYLIPLLSSRVNLDQELLKLIDFANEYNGHDNITAVAIRIKVRPNMEQMP